MKEIINIAESFVSELNHKKPFHPDYQYDFQNSPKEYFECWYFEFKIILKDGIRENRIEHFGAALGFIIYKKDKKVKILSFGEMQEMDEVQIRRAKLYEILSQIQKAKWDSKVIRELTGIKPRDILKFKKTFSSKDFSNEENKLLAIKEMERFQN